MSQLIDRVTIGVGIVSGLLAILMFAPPASAVTGADWNAGNIMDDGIFFNPGEMSTSDIQNFLNSKVPVCDTWGTQPYAGTTRAAYGASRGYPAPYTCLKSYIENPSTHQNNANGGSVTGGWTSAQIIKYAADTYNINPKVLIVLLQKEQGLVTDDWPWTIQYRSATGYGCPDTAPCDAEYYGFYNQVTKAAYQFRRYATYPTEYRYKAFQSNYIQYNPNVGCGGTNVNIANQATAGLYSYTPYQPNASALANLYGSGDGCGAYGNRNFWRMYNDWFGPTHGTFSAQPVWQQVYSNSGNALGWNATLLAGQSARVVVVMKNTGNMTWTNTGVFGVSSTNTRLATYSWGRQSNFCDGTWVINCTRPASLKEASVAPGATGTFGFTIKAPKQAGSYIESFSPVIDGRTVFSNGVVSIRLNVVAPTFSAQPVWQQVYSNSGNALGWNATLLAGQSARVVVVMKNTGNMTWTNTGVFGVSSTNTRLATYSWGRQSNFCDGTWVINCTRPASLKEASVAPGATGTFGFTIKAPKQAGSYIESFSPVIDGRTVFSKGVVSIGLNVPAPNFSAQSVWQQVYTDSLKTTPLGWNANLTKGQTAYAVTIMKNTSNFTWTKSGGLYDTRLATYPWGHQSVFCDSSWISCTRPTSLKEASVAPGATGTFEFAIKAPQQTGLYSESFGLVVDGKSTFKGTPTTYKLTVQ